MVLSLNAVLPPVCQTTTNRDASLMQAPDGLSYESSYLHRWQLSPRWSPHLSRTVPKSIAERRAL